MYQLVQMHYMRMQQLHSRIIVVINAGACKISPTLSYSLFKSERVYASYINDMYDMLSDALMNLEILIEIYKRTSI